MKAALYARVSTKDKDQTPETQLYALREYVAARGWQTVKEYVDQASATNLRDRTAWRELLEHVRKGGIDLDERGTRGRRGKYHTQIFCAGCDARQRVAYADDEGTRETESPLSLQSEP
jgi:DNA invertase Pin-like site-specific DNA recombinase